MSDPTQPPVPDPHEPEPQVPQPQIPEPQEIPSPPAPDVVTPPVHDIPGDPAAFDVTASTAPEVPEPVPAPPPPPAPAPAPEPTPVVAPAVAAAAPAQWPAGPAYAAAPAPAPASAAGGQTSSNAIIALILAVGSFVICPIILAVVALVFANMAGKEIAGSGGRVQGGGLVTASKVIAWINIGLTAAAIIIGLFVVILIAIAGTTS